MESEDWHNSAFQMLDPGLQRDAAAASVQPRRRAYRSGAGMASAASAPEHLSLTATQDVQLHSDPAVWQQPMNGRLCTHHEQGGAAQAPSLSVPGSVPLHGEAHTFQTIPRPFSGQRLYRHPSASSHPQSVSAFMLRQQQPQSPEVAAQIQQHRFEGQHLQQHLQQPRPPPALAMVRAHPHLQVRIGPQWRSTHVMAAGHAVEEGRSPLSPSMSGITSSPSPDSVVTACAGKRSPFAESSAAPPPTPASPCTPASHIWPSQPSSLNPSQTSSCATSKAPSRTTSLQSADAIDLPHVQAMMGQLCHALSSGPLAPSRN